MDPVLQFGSLTAPPSLLLALLALAVILLVGRVVMKLAWKLVMLAILAVTAVWILSSFGFQVL